MSDPCEATPRPPAPYVPLKDMVRQCAVCGRDYKAAARDTITCGTGCAMVFRAKRQAEKKAASLNSAPRYSVEPPVCGETSTPVSECRQSPAEPFPEASTHSWVPQVVAPVAHTGRYQRVMFWPDTHVPYQDDRAVALALEVARFYRPELLICLGDMLDCLSLSRFAYDVGDPQSHLQHELDTWYGMAEAIGRATPGADRVFIKGNHEDRFDRWLWSVPQFRGLHGFNLVSLLKLSKRGFRPNLEDELDLCAGSLTVRHGTKLGGSFSGLAARQEMTVAGTSGITGHTHRLCKYLHRDKVGLRVWIEGGSLCINPQKYIKGSVANWHQGVTLGEIETDGNSFDLEPIAFRMTYRCRVGGVELSA